MADLSDFNSAFSPLLNRYTGALNKAGIGYRLDSGYRSPEQQAEIYARSNQGQSFAAAPAWRSFHNYGLAADVIPTNAADYGRMHDLARQAGLYDAQGGLGFTGYDPPHVEMPGHLSDLIAQYHLANWRPQSQPAPASGAIAYAGPSGQPSRVGTPTPGTSLTSNPLDLVSTLESSNTNVLQQIHDKNSDRGIPASGFYQIIDPTWRTYAAQAGVDLNKYPTAMSAPRDIQTQVAGLIPVSQWGPNTVAALQKQFPGYDTSQTLGQWQSKALGGSGTAPGAAPAVAGAGQPAPASGGPLGQLATALKPLTGDKGKGGDKSGQGDQPPDFRLTPQGPGQAVGGPMMMGAGGQNVPGRTGVVGQNALAQLAQYAAAGAAQPMSAASAPGLATGMPSIGLPGTTLNSPGQLQMALMTGSINPYDMYARAGMGAGGFGST